MFHALNADTADELWQKAAQWFAHDGLAVNQASRAGGTKEVMNSALALRDTRQRWIASRSPAMNPAFAIAEVVWILCGRNDSAMLNYFNPRLPEFAGSDDTYHGAYGHRLRQHLGFDQFDRAYCALSKKPESRQIVLQIWDSGSDLPDENGLPAAPDIPCNIVSLLKVRNDRLEWTQIMRSNDLFRGLPHNIIQFTCLHEIFAGWLGIEPGSYHHYSDSLHLYAKDGKVEDHLDVCKLPLNSDSLAVPKKESDASFQVLSEFADFLVLQSNGGTDVIKRLEELPLGTAFQNFAAILAADALRRRECSMEMKAALARCTNPCLTTMFERWRDKPRKP